MMHYPINATHAIKPIFKANPRWNVKLQQNHLLKYCIITFFLRQKSTFLTKSTFNSSSKQRWFKIKMMTFDIICLRVLFSTVCNKVEEETVHRSPGWNTSHPHGTDNLHAPPQKKNKKNPTYIWNSLKCANFDTLIQNISSLTPK